MSRSHRKTPIAGLCADTDAPFKTTEHRRARHAARMAVDFGEDPPHEKRYGDPWLSCKDGKRLIDGDSKWMRK